MLVLTAVAVAFAGGCTRGEASGTRPPASRAVIDSAIPIGEALRRFREGRTKPAELCGGARSRDSLVAAFVRALERRDTAALRPLVVDAAEFAWLYYPSSPLARPPYQLPPDLMWLQLQGQSERGASLLLSDRAGVPLGYLDHDCKSPRTEGGNRIYGHCLVRRVTAQGDTVAEPLFGLILERGGTFKFVSYANKLD